MGGAVMGAVLAGAVGLTSLLGVTTTPAAPTAAAAARPTTAPAAVAPVLAVELAGNEVLTRILNPQNGVIYRASEYASGKAAGEVAFSPDGRFHFIAGPDPTRTYTYTVQAVNRAGKVSVPDTGSILTSGLRGTYRTSISLAPVSVAAFAKAADAFVAQSSGDCSSDRAYDPASKELTAAAEKAATANPPDEALQARWSRALTAAGIPTRGCAAVAAVAAFAAREVKSFLSGKRVFSVAVQPRWNARTRTCYLRMIAGDAKGRTGAPWVREALTGILTEAGCQALPQPWL